MCFIVLIQNSKGGGLASGFSSSNEILGVRKTASFGILYQHNKAHNTAATTIKITKNKYILLF
jgi:hypothetical protein